MFWLLKRVADPRAPDVFFQLFSDISNRALNITLLGLEH